MLISIGHSASSKSMPWTITMQCLTITANNDLTKKNYEFVSRNVGNVNRSQCTLKGYHMVNYFARFETPSQWSTLLQRITLNRAEL